MKRLYWIFLALVLVCGLAAGVSAAELIAGTTITWELDDNTGTLTFSGTGAMYDYTTEEDAWDEIPWRSNKDNINKIIF